MKVNKLEQPLNADERFLYAIAVRLEVLIEQVSAITEYIAKKEDVAVTEAVVEEAVVEEKKPAPRKRAPRKKVTDNEPS